jgi:O-antigen/teichoic acid export membrane protein
MTFYKKIYNMLALFILTIGLLLLPIIDKFVKDVAFSPNLLRTIFLIFIADIVISYLFSYKRSILLADQNGYILSLCYALYSIGVILTQVIITIYFFNIILFFASRLVFRIIENIIISYVVNYKYPYIKDGPIEKLSNNIRKNIFENTKALAFHYIGNYLTGGINNIVISTFIGLTAVGVYGNYSILIVAATGMISQFSNGITASFGNMIAQETKDKILDVFEVSFFINFVIYNMAGVMALILITPFVRLWMGASGVLSFASVLTIVTAFYLSGISQPLGAIRASAGIFQPDKYLHVLIAGLNIFLSVVLVKIAGMPGVFVGSLVCICIKEISVLPHIVYKYIFERTSDRYFKLLALSISSTIISYGVTFFICRIIGLDNKLLDFVLKSVICFSVPNIVVLILWSRTRYVSAVMKIVRSFI